MAKTAEPLKIADHKRSTLADAVLEQMYGYFSRDERPSPAVAEPESRRAA